ncbi:MAG: hypothetical protein COA82_09110 [Alkaliphilus sp.]|nr:MAG: hypothetical protein COA82_09110 [Alkaliphilus sp.]
MHSVINLKDIMIDYLKFKTFVKLIKYDTIDVYGKMKIAVIRDANHPWGKLDDMELLKSAGLYSIDYKNKIEGFNLAGILLLGKDETPLCLMHFYLQVACLLGY